MAVGMLVNESVGGDQSHQDESQEPIYNGN